MSLPADIAVTYAALDEWFARQTSFNPWLLRRETIRRIEGVTGRPLVCYVARTSNLHNRSVASLTSIDDQDIRGFNDLINAVPESESSCDVFVVSNGGRPETTERIVQLIRRRFDSVRFIVPSNAFSAATMMTFSGGELAESWISEHMLKCKRDDPRVRDVVEFFSSAENHKTHGRSVSREKAMSVGLVVKCTEDSGIDELVHCKLFNRTKRLLHRDGTVNGVQAAV